jgi:hypothetical protein
MAIEPDSGPPGTVISVRSVTPSPLEGDQLALVGLFAADSEEPITVVTLDVNRDGSWSGSIVVPSNAPPGDYVVAAEAFLLDPVESGGEGVSAQQEAASFPYAPVAFEVTPAPRRPPLPTPGGQPPAQVPVVTTPSVTG